MFNRMDKELIEEREQDIYDLKEEINLLQNKHLAII